MNLIKSNTKRAPKMVKQFKKSKAVRTGFYAVLITVILCSFVPVFQTLAEKAF